MIITIVLLCIINVALVIYLVCEIAKRKLYEQRYHEYRDELYGNRALIAKLQKDIDAYDTVLEKIADIAGSIVSVVNNT